MCTFGSTRKSDQKRLKIFLGITKTPVFICPAAIRVNPNIFGSTRKCTRANPANAQK